MPLTPPLSILAAFPGWTTGFSLRYRQEQSTQASGRIIVKDMGAPLWTLRAVSKSLGPNELDYWRARLATLENGLVQFWGFPKSRCFPQAYPFGSWPTLPGFNGTNATLASINANRKAVSLSGLPVGFALSIGDYISIIVATGSTPRNDLHQVVEAATATAGTTPEFEIRPHVWPDVTTGKAVSVKQPACLMALVPGSINHDAQLAGWGSVSFSAMEARL